MYHWETRAKPRLSMLPAPSIPRWVRATGLAVSGAGLTLTGGYLNAAEATPAQPPAAEPRPAAVFTDQSNDAPKKPDSRGGQSPPTAATSARSEASQKILAKVKQEFPYSANPPESKGDATAKGADPNTIVMPTMIVREAKVPEVSAKDVLSDDAFKKLTRKSGMGPDYGRLKAIEDRRVDRIKDIQSLAGEKEFKQPLQEASFRRSDPILDAMDKAANNGRR